MGIVDDAQGIAEWIDHYCGTNIIADILYRCVGTRSKRKQTYERLLNILDTPIGKWTGLTHLCIGVQANLETTDAEADIKRLIEEGG